MTRDEWLAQLKAGDTVLISIGDQRHQVTTLTRTSRTLLTIGRNKNFRRKDGMKTRQIQMAHLFRLEMPQ